MEAVATQAQPMNLATIRAKGVITSLEGGKRDGAATIILLARGRGMVSLSRLMKTSRFPLFGAALFILAAVFPAGLSAAPAPAQLKVSDNHRFLVTGEGKPFFWLGDTAWELFHRTTREEAETYLQNRAQLGFTVIQAVALAELNGLHDPNAYGFVPLQNDDPTKPAVVEGPNNDYWDHVDFVIDRANQLGLVVALLPTWGDKWNLKWGTGPVIFNPTNARAYGEWIGRRYREKSIVWILGGDRPIESDEHRAIVEAMAEGVRAGDGGRHLITLHPSGNNGSSTWFHDAPWLDFNMRQNGHSSEYRSFHNTLVDYQRTPAKPVVDGEPMYEDHPVDFKQAEYGYAVGADVRRAVYWDLFNGAFGHTYGHHSVWQMYTLQRKPVNDPLYPWTEAIRQPGASQMQFARKLLESRPYLTRIPDPQLVMEKKPETVWPGAGRYRFVATRDEAGSYAMIYAPVGRRFTVNLKPLNGAHLRAWWFNPRDGSARSAGAFPKTDQREFISPNPGELLDWVLVIDDADKKFPVPGTH
jgi:Protein of unknown function (DUF4038)/Putative collagen-binding domain of a collagenase